MSGRRKAPPVRPRYGRIAMAATSMTVTAVSILGGAGALPSSATEPDGRGAIAPVAGSPDPTPEAPAAGSDDAARRPDPGTRRPDAGVDPGPVVPPLPERSGAGRRVVFSEGQQRVWLVGSRGGIRRTYLVSGSVYDNLEPGTYSVYSRSEQAWGIDDSGSMRWFVRFAQGDNAAIGFHDIPVSDGARVQSVAQLGTPLSHGCIRQRTPDARALWDFAPIGTTVVVTA